MGSEKEEVREIRETRVRGRPRRRRHFER